MKYIFPQLLLMSFLLTFDSDEWIYFKKVDYIHFITEDDEYLHFITRSGIYSYNDIEDKYYYNFDLSNMIDFKEPIYHFYFEILWLQASYVGL